jgi:hypothetical protein
MRKIVAISTLCAFVAWPLAAQAPNPCEVFGQAATARSEWREFVALFGDLESGIEVGLVALPPLRGTDPQRLQESLGVDEDPGFFTLQTEMSHVAIPGAGGIEFVTAYEGSWECLIFHLLHVREGRIEYAFDDGPITGGCRRPVARPVIVAGQIFIAVGDIFDRETGALDNSAYVSLLALESLRNSSQPVCAVRFEDEVAVAIAPVRAADRRDLRAHEAALARLHARRHLLKDILSDPELEMRYALGNGAKPLSAASGTKAASFRAGEIEYRLTARPAGTDRTIFRLRPMGSRRYFDLYIVTQRPPGGYTVERAP